MDYPDKYPLNDNNDYYNQPSYEENYNQNSNNADGFLQGLQILLGLLSFSGVIQVFYVNCKGCYDDYSKRKKIKKRKIKENELLENELLITECSICLDSYEIGDTISILSCEHFYHTKCLNEWLNKKEECPLCREEI